MIRILSIDGGGMKGIISAIVIERLEELIKIYAKDEAASISDYFDLFGGTSTGAIITALLLAPDDGGGPKYSAADIVKLYKTHGKDIFKKRPLYPINTCFGLLGSKYTSKEFSKLLDTYLGDLCLADMRKQSLYTSYNMSNQKAVFFSSLTKKGWEKEDYKIKDIVLASTAAPTYFPPKQIYNQYCPNNCYIDGGIIANNPSLCLLMESMKMKQFTSFDDVMLLSIGNAGCPNYYDYKQVKRWGLINWAFAILSILMEGSEETVDYQVKRIFENHRCSNQYLRVEKRVEKSMPSMDSVKEEDILYMIEVGEALVKECDPYLKPFARELVRLGK